MTTLSKLITALKGWKEGLFGKKAPEPAPVWQDHSFYTEENRKTEKLASLARWIEQARKDVEKKRGQKKRFSHIEAAIRVAQTERLEIETNRRVYSPRFGAWLLKE